MHFWLLGASTHSLSLSNRPNQKAPTSGALWFGLPERIRTFDLQSRSLTRYPAVPRVDMKIALDPVCGVLPLVDPKGIEPSTSALRTQRSPS